MLTQGKHGDKEAAEGTVSEFTLHCASNQKAQAGLQLKA